MFLTFPGSFSLSWITLTSSGIFLRWVSDKYIILEIVQKPWFFLNGQSLMSKCISPFLLDFLALQKLSVCVQNWHTQIRSSLQNSSRGLSCFWESSAPGSPQNESLYVFLMSASVLRGIRWVLQSETPQTRQDQTFKSLNVSSLALWYCWISAEMTSWDDCRNESKELALTLLGISLCNLFAKSHRQRKQHSLRQITQMLCSHWVVSLE